MDIVSWLLSRRYTDMSIIGLGAIRGANCTVKDIVHQDGTNTVTFEWTGTDGTTKTRDMVVYDGTPIYVWESGNTYHYGDLAIYESQFYRCIVENNDVTFDSTKWNEIGSPDGNYDIVQSTNLLPARFTAADRKLYYVIDENCFYLWNGTAWIKTISNKIADLDDINLEDLAEGDVLVWDSVNEKWVNKAKFDEYKTTFVGTQAQWDALTPAQQNVYEIINITDDGEVINLGVYLEKKAVLPTANADNVGKTYIYTGASNANYKKGACYECQQVGQTYTWVQVSVSKDDFNALGTASTKNYTSNVRPNNTDLVESQAVYSAINSALSSIYVPRGDLSCAELTSDLLIPANVGNVYTMSDSGTTSALFINGAGHPIAVNDNVGIIRAGADTIMFNLMGNAFDLHDYQTKELETPITIDGTQATEVEGALGGLNGAVDKRVTYEYNGKVGAKNLLRFPYNENDKVRNGVTWLANDDGSVNASGTITGTTYSYINCNLPSDTLVLKAGDYIASIISSVPQMHIGVRLTNWDGAAYISLAIAYNNAPVTFTVTQAMVDAIKNGTSSIYVILEINNYADEFSDVVYPMIRYASDTDSTWQPYAKTNYELTQDVNSLSYIKDVPIAKGSGTNSIIESDLQNNIASGNNSHAEGQNSQALGTDSHAQNIGTVARYLQTAIGSYNVAQGSNKTKVDTDHALIIGNGTDVDHRSNALAVQWDGTVVFQDGSTMKSAKTVYYVSTSGNDNNNGTQSSPLATVNKALELGADVVYLEGGRYFQQIDLSKTNKSKVKISNISANTRVIFTDADGKLATSATQTSGYTRIYQFPCDVTFDNNNKWIFQENVADTSTVIDDNDRLPQQRGYKYRCYDTKIVKCQSNTLSDALNEIENAEENEYKWYLDNGILYCSCRNEINSNAPISYSVGKTLFLNPNKNTSVELIGISCQFIGINITDMINPQVIDCQVFNYYGAGGIEYSRSIDANIIRCETARIFSGSVGDGINAHGQTGGTPIAHNVTATITDCWSHDNNDDGFSDHECCESVIVGGLFEYNGKAGITPSYGAHCTCNGVISRNNYNGFYYVGEASQAEQGQYGQLLCIDCVSESNMYGDGQTHAGYLSAGNGNRVTLVNCKSLNNRYGYYASSGTSMRMIDCTSYDTQFKVGSGTFSITSVIDDINTTLNTKLDKISSLPTPSVTYLDKIYLLTSTQTGYQKGGIYQCVSDGASTPTYSWQLISSADMVEFTAQELQAMW